MGKPKNLPSHTYSIARNFIMKMCRILKKLSKKETEMDHSQREETKTSARYQRNNQRLETKTHETLT